MGYFFLAVSLFILLHFLFQKSHEFAASGEGVGKFCCGKFWAKAKGILRHNSRVLASYFLSHLFSWKLLAEAHFLRKFSRRLIEQGIWSLIYLSCNQFFFWLRSEKKCRKFTYHRIIKNQVCKPKILFNICTGICNMFARSLPKDKAQKSNFRKQLLFSACAESFNCVPVSLDKRKMKNSSHELLNPRVKLSLGFWYQ